MDTASEASGAVPRAPIAAAARSGAAEPRGAATAAPGGWRADAVLFVIAVLWWGGAGFAYSIGMYAYVPRELVLADLALGALGCLGLWWRRSHPLGVGVLLCVAQSVSSSAAAALVVALIGVAARCSRPQVAAVVAAGMVLALPWIFLIVPTGADTLFMLLVVFVVFTGSLGWGIALRARRELVERLRADVRREVEERERRLAAARVEERRRIAREMHDVVAHRMSLLSVHAAGLAYRTERAEQGKAPPLEPAELGAAVGVIRDNAHQALEELAATLTVLRSADTAPGQGDDHAGIAAPRTRSLDGIAGLVEQARGAGQRVRDEFDVPGGAEPPGQVCRTAYRVVQEGLTNTLKHAPGARVEVRISGAPGRGITVSVRNPLAVGVADSEIPGAGAGLTGLAERVALDGGSLVHGSADGRFRLVADLPWPDAPEVP